MHPDAEISTNSDSLACPKCGGKRCNSGRLVCDSCGQSYVAVGGVTKLTTAAFGRRADVAAWSQHWSDEYQGSLSHKFFSFYRKAVFARTMRYFVDRYFPPAGVFVEAGSGTSETSMRINKLQGGRLLVALDIIPSVLKQCHIVMDARLCGDIFRLPLRNSSVDGIWNVGVMEHFTHEQIDIIMGEFYRILKPGGRVILLWPGVDSIPQKVLKLAAKIIQKTSGEPTFQFHPEEISQLKSLREGNEVFVRNGFSTVRLEYGFRSLLAFKILVGKKAQRPNAK